MSHTSRNWLNRSESLDSEWQNFLHSNGASIWGSSLDLLKKKNKTGLRGMCAPLSELFSAVHAKLERTKMAHNRFREEENTIED